MNARLATRAGGLILALVVAGAIAGCGDEPDPRPVRLEITAPADAAVVREDSFEVRGRVKPAGARVLVLGRPATVTGGEFRARVPLRMGPNVIDVAGSKRGAASAWAAVRVAREALVRVPDLAGVLRDDAVGRLEALGVRVEVVEEGGLLDRLLGGDWVVCGVRPGAGSELPKGASVELTVSKTC